MLASIREKIQGLFATIVVLIIGVPFALWGINAYFHNDADLVVAKVGSSKISVANYRRALERQRQTMQRYLGRNFDPRLFESAAFKQQVLNGMIDELLITRYVEDYFYAANDKTLAQKIRDIPEFQGEHGFDPKRYEEVLRNAGFSVAGFEQSMREEALAEQVRQGFMQPIAPSADVDRILELETQRREVAYLQVTPEALMPKVTISDDAVKSYYDTHADEFKTAEQVKVDYLRLTAADIAKGMKLSEDELRKFYDDEAARFTTPEERKARHILFSLAPNAKPEEKDRVLAQANAVRKQLLGGADFAALARKYSQDPGSASKGGELGFNRRGVFAPEFDSALFSLKKAGDLSEPVKTQYGYHLIQLEAVKPEVKKPLSQVRGEIGNLARTRKAEERFFELAQTLQNTAYEHPESLKPAADALGLSIQHSDWFTRKGGAGIAAQPKVLDAAFNPEIVAQQRNSDAIELGPTDYVALRVAERRPSTTRPLAEVKDQIVTRLKRERAESDAAARADTLLQQLQKGEAWATIAKSDGVKSTPAKTVSRRDAQGFDARVLDAAFKAGVPQAKPVYGKVDLGAQGQAIFALTKVESGTAQGDATLRGATQATLERRTTQEYYDAFLRALRKSESIEVYNDRL